MYVYSICKFIILMVLKNNIRGDTFVFMSVFKSMFVNMLKQAISIRNYFTI